MPLDAAVGITAAVAFSSKFVERSKFSSRHDAIYDKELEKSLKAAESFHHIPKEDVDFFEAEGYTLLHSKSMDDLMDYRSAQDEYKEREWYREPRAKFQLRGRVREAKRRLQSSVSRERSHVHELETYSRSVHSRSGSVRSFASDASTNSGLDLNRSLQYRTDSVSIRAVNHSPPSASLEDVSHDETREDAHTHVSEWLSYLRTPSTAQQLAESYRSRSLDPSSLAGAVEDWMLPWFKSKVEPQATFLMKLYALLECPKNHHMIHWDQTGEHIIIERLDQLALHVPPDIYGLSTLAGFSRDLMTYGFMFKVDVDPTADDTRTWSHPILNRHSSPQKLLQISNDVSRLFRSCRKETETLAFRR